MKFKILLIFILILSFHRLASAQSLKETSSHGKVGITVSSFSDNSVANFGSTVGSSGYEGVSFFSMGINYIHPGKKWLQFETGVEYSVFTMKSDPHPFYNMNIKPHYTDVSLIDIPLAFRAYFFKYFYVSSGALLDIDISKSSSINNQSGIGGMLGAGVNYDFNFGFSLFINPYVKIHSLLPFAVDNNRQQRIVESAIKFGISYQL